MTPYIFSFILHLCIIFKIDSKCAQPTTTIFTKSIDFTWYLGPPLYFTELPFTEPALNCQIKRDESKFFGTYYQGKSSNIFDVNISDLRSIVINSGEYVNSILFNFINGDSILYGDDKNNESSSFNNRSSTNINLENKVIVAAHIRSGWWIDNIQFLIFDLFTNTYTWTDALGGHGGKPKYIDAASYAPEASNFQIVSIAGSVAPDNSVIQTLKIGFSYELCNPFLPDPTNPLRPPFLPTTTGMEFQYTDWVLYPNSNIFPTTSYDPFDSTGPMFTKN